MDNSHTQLEILFLPLSSAVAAMFPRQSGFRERTPLLCLLIHSRLETWTQTQPHIVSTAIQGLFIHCFYITCLLSAIAVHCRSHSERGERCGDAAQCLLQITNNFIFPHRPSLRASSTSAVELDDRSSSL